MEQKGKLVVISGFSGAGKGTLMKALLAAHPDRYALSVSATTRDPRPGEKDGVDYFFVTDETFDSMIQKDDFLEYAKYVSHSYGTPRSYVEENLNLGKNVILEIECECFPGGTRISFTEILPVFIYGDIKIFPVVHAGTL